MRVIDENDQEVLNPDINFGYGVIEEIIIAHHDAQEAVEEEWHYEVVAEYPNGGKDVAKVVDVEGHPAMPAYDEVEEVMRWYWYDPDHTHDEPSDDETMTTEEIMDAIFGNENGSRAIADIILGGE